MGSKENCCCCIPIKAGMIILIVLEIVGCILVAINKSPSAGLFLPRIITLIISLTCATDSGGVRIAAFIVWLVTAFIFLVFDIIAFNEWK